MAPNRGLQLIRIERYKELAFEHKLYWDLRRWFTFDMQIRDYRRRMINPFLFAKGATLNEYGNPSAGLSPAPTEDAVVIKYVNLGLSTG
jgi:hypothetical protein